MAVADTAADRSPELWTACKETCGEPTHRVLTTTQRSQHRWGQLWEEVLGKHPGRAGGGACMCVVMRAWDWVCLFQRDVGGQRDQIGVRSLPTFPSDCASPFLWDAASPYGCSWSGQLDKLWLREEGPRRAMRSFIHIGASPLHKPILPTNKPS